MFLTVLVTVVATVLVLWLLGLSGCLAAILDLWPPPEAHHALHPLQQLLGGGFRGQRHHHHQAAGGVVRSVAASSPPVVSLREQATSPNHPLGVNRAALTNVREMMATSLERIRQLEEEAKAIPLLQVKLSVLKEEKRLLMLQLQSKPSQLDQRSIGIGDNHILGSSPKDTVASDGLDSLIQELENQVGLPKATLSEGKVQTRFLHTSTHSTVPSTREVDTFPESPPLRPSRSLDRAKPAVQIQKTIGVGCSVATRSIAVGDSGELLPKQSFKSGASPERLPSTWEAQGDWKYIPRAKLHACARCAERSKKQFESKETATEPEAGRDVRSKLEQLTFDVCEPTSVKPDPRPCRDCQERSRRLSAHAATNTDAVATLSVGVSAILPQSSQPPVESPPRPRRSRSQGSQTQRVLKGNVGVQISPSPVRRRDVLLQADVVERRHVGLQVVTVEAKAHTVSVGTGISDVRRVICDRCTNLRQRSVSVGNHVNQRDAGVAVSMQKETTSRGSGDCSVSDVLCEKCELKQTETIGVGDFDVNGAVCETCTEEKSTSEEKKPAVESVGTAMTSSMEEVKASSDVGGVRLCDKCSSQITNVAKDFIDKNVLDPALPTLSSRIPKLSGRSPKRPASARPSSISLSFENRHALLGSPDDRKPTTGLAQQLPEPPTRMTERAEKHEPSKEVKAACKVLNDYLMKPERGDPNKLKTAVSLIQQEWFQISSPADADPNVVEDYMDTFEEFSRHLLHRIVNMADVNGNTAIHYAVSHGNFDVVSILLDSKVCDVSKQNKAGYTCMMLVSLAEIKNETHRLVVQRLFQLGDVNTKAMQNGQTALMLAASHGRAEMVKLLLDAGAEPNVQDNDGSTALMCAAEHGYIDIVRLLLASPDTEVCLADNDGSTALTIAMEAGHKDTALLIYANSNFSRGSSPVPTFFYRRYWHRRYSSLRARKHPTPRSTPPPSRPPRTPPPPSPARSRRTSTSTIN